MANDDIVPYSLSQHPDPGRHAVGVTALLLGLFLAPIFWAGNLMIDYALVSHACYPGAVPLRVPAAGFGFVWPLMLAFDLVTLAVIAGGFVLSLRNWRVTGPPQEHVHQFMHKGEGRSRFFGMVAMGWAAVLFLVVATQSASLYWLTLCGG